MSDNFTFLDSTGTTKTARATDDGSGKYIGNTRLSDATGDNFAQLGSASNQAGASPGAKSLLAVPPGNWSVNHAPAVANLAVAQKTAGSAGVCHVATSISGSWASDGTNNGTARNAVLVLRDGATGAGTILGQWTVARLTTTATDPGNQGSFCLSGLNIPGTAATAMTAEFTGTAADHTFYSVMVTGYDTV